ncbi:MAG: Rpn family recombination-promoting nuclease/putative transposase [Fibrobacter sp.]|jgi:predicted transposase/invertase (TIGR01784 family)|nr:Rpn family recombination-promoting nuclease/putative transposase [Fibrobacter sp.]
MNQPIINNPHDKFFKEAFSHIELVKSFIKTYLQPRINFQINLDELQLFQNDSVDSSLKESFSDIVYKTEIIPEKIPVYLLFEHKSYPDSQIGIQMEKYRHMLIENLIKSHSGNVFFVIPIIIYNGERICDFSTYLSSYSELNVRIDSKYEESLNCEFFDVSHIPDNQIRGSAFLRIVFFAMKYVHSPQILNKLDEICVLFKEMSKKVDVKNFFDTFSLYVQNAAPKNLIEQSVKKIKSWERRKNMPEVSRVFQSIRDEGWRKGMEEGETKGKKEGKIEGKIEGKLEDAQRMLQKGMSKELILEITGLPFEKIVELEKSIEKNENG